MYILDETKIENHGTFKTTSEYWDCQCSDKFIHPTSTQSCLVCGAKKEDQPDSRVNEICEENLAFPSFR